jgi:hypothetical protein
MKNNLKINDIDHLIFHRWEKIVQTVETYFSDLDKI